MSDPAIRIDGMNKYYGSFHALQDIDLTVERGEKIVICGPSGSGKSTLIRCINRLEEHQSGTIEVMGTCLDDNIDHIDEIRREAGMVFQNFNLFPHMSVLDNCTLAPTLVRKTPRAEAEAAAMRYLERVKIPEQANKYPGQLSGGQQQRVAIARALMQDPQIILADEPIASLDPMNAQLVMDDLRRIHEEDGRTVIANLHTLDTARRYCDRVIGMRDGKMVFDGSPEELTTDVAREIYGADESFNEAATSTAIEGARSVRPEEQVPTGAMTPAAVTAC
mgnify:CR=1 FL=1